MRMNRPRFLLTLAHFVVCVCLISLFVPLEGKETQREARIDSVLKKSSRTLLELQTKQTQAATNGIIWNGDRIDQMMEEMVVGVNSIKVQHYRIKLLQTTWMSPELDNMLEVYSDVGFDPMITNVVNTYVNETGGYHDWRKITYMLKVWSTPPYKRVNWFVISHDSAYIHLENLYDWLSTRDPSEPQVIGDVQCREDGLQYPSWRGSIVISRAVLDNIDWDHWYAVERSHLRKSQYSYDVIIGQYSRAMNVALVDHPGFLAAPYSTSSTLLQRFSEHFADPKGWVLPFLPISSDQSNSLDFIADLHQKLTPIRTKEGASPDPYDPSSCTCKPHVASICWPEDSAFDEQNCRFPNSDSACNIV